ncbi:MAG: hypothetical protein AB8G15_20430 [Saprospiraceae bacterium]
MLSDKLESLLASFSKLELNQFRKFLLSPFFNENQEIIKLFDVLQKALNAPHAKQSLDKKTAWKVLYGKTPYKDIQFRRLLSDLTKLAHQYLSHRTFQEDPFAPALRLLDSINTPSLQKHFTGTVRQLENLQKKSGLNNTDFHYNFFLLNYKSHLHLEKMGVKRKEFSTKNLENADYHLDCYYIINKLKHYCDALGYKNVLSKESSLKDFPNLTKFIEENDFLEEPSIKAHYLVTLMLLHPEEERYFKELKVFLQDHYQLFTREEGYVFFIHLKNYCIDIKINKGKSAYFFELFDIYKLLIESKIIFHQATIHPQSYKNIISVGLHVKAFDWVEAFIQEYTDYLPKVNHEDALNYNLAKVYFYKKDFDRVLTQLGTVKDTSLIYALGRKLLLIKTYYEVSEANALDSLIDSFRIYVQRNRLISRDVKQPYLNVLRFVKKLLSIPTYDKEAILKTKQQIVDCKAVASKRWLLEKVEEML